MFVTTFLLLHFSSASLLQKQKPPKAKKQQNKTHTIIHAQHKVKVPNLRTEGQQKLQCWSTGTFWIWPDYRFYHSSISNFKTKQNKQTQIQSLSEDKKNTGTSIILWYTPKIKYPNSIHGSNGKT